MKKHFPAIAIVGFLAAALAFYLLYPWQDGAAEPATANNGALPKTVIPAAEREKILRDANAKLPLMVDAATRLNKIALDDDGFIYYYQFTDTDILANMPDWQGQLTRRLKRDLCNTPENRAYLDGNLRYSYRYAGQDDAEIFSLTITKQDCR